MKHITCNACGGNDFALVTHGRDRLHKIDERRFDVVRCRRCSLVCLNPQPEAVELEKYYPADYGPYQADNPLLSYGLVLAAVKRLFARTRPALHPPQVSADRTTDTYLDFGCGGGMNLEKMHRKHPYWDLYGLDMSEHACAATRAKGFTVYCGTIGQVNLPESFFNHVYMSHVIEHLNDPQAALMALRRSMKEGADITLATPNADSWAFALFRSFWLALDTPRHLFLFSPKTLTAELNAADFTVTGIEFDREPKTAIRSLAYLCFGQSTRIPALFWHVLWYLLFPISFALSRFGKTSIMTVRAVAR
jgi:2-polyprenyl-3-methyl-5-hydroxy-6-metoxy-1,4-benzoquinol methylase